MAGRGPAPKDPKRRAGHLSKAERNGLRIIPAEPVAQPALPEFDVEVEVDGELVGRQFRWPSRTREWWKMWRESPLTTDYTEADWQYLLDTALVHARHWSGDAKAAAELRLRVGKFGSTPEDRQRLRIAFADADERDEKRKTRQGGTDARKRYGGPRAVASD